jgi:hypothetical protein
MLINQSVGFTLFMHQLASDQRPAIPEFHSFFDVGKPARRNSCSIKSDSV